MSSTRSPFRPLQQLAGIYRRSGQLLHEGAKFLTVGLIGIGVTNLVFIPLHALGLGPLTSVTIATVVATVVTFLGNRYWSFRDRQGGGTAREGVTFFILNGVGLLIQYAVLGFSNYALGLTTKVENVIAVNIGIGIGTLFRFWSYRKWVWVPPEVRLARLRVGRHRKGRAEAESGPSEPEVTAVRRPVTQDRSRQH
ncbi:MAG TPA: GtrA family protein [Streptosporangiaceae bacterium]|nr:GtrA family protein [Streptosporangiaceae bacterium]